LNQELARPTHATPGFDLPRWFGEVLDGLEIKTAFAAGISYGCYLVQLLFTSYPERSEKFIGLAWYHRSTISSISKRYSYRENRQGSDITFRR
jgi:pimeloyl-ACP methyl ester carboxylesterase